MVDLGGPREVDSMRVLLGGSGTDLSVYASSPGGEIPDRLREMRRIARVEGAGTDVTVSFPEGVLTRRVVIWLERLPEINPDEYQGEIREITVDGRR